MHDALAACQQQWNDPLTQALMQLAVPPVPLPVPVSPAHDPTGLAGAGSPRSADHGCEAAVAGAGAGAGGGAGGGCRGVGGGDGVADGAAGATTVPAPAGADPALVGADADSDAGVHAALLDWEDLAAHSPDLVGRARAAMAHWYAQQC